MSADIYYISVDNCNFFAHDGVYWNIEKYTFAFP